eukprot:gene8121-12581_t
MSNDTLSPILYDGKTLKVLNQLKLPLVLEYEDVNNLKDVYDAIHLMKIRGAPAIAIIALLGLAVEIKKKENINYTEWLLESLDYIGKSRPTAVTLFNAIDEVKDRIKNVENDKIPGVVVSLAEEYLKRDEDDNQKISSFGRDYILNFKKENVQILTHCNTGALATAKYGTALGIIRFLKPNIKQVYCTETRPYNQGARLTAFELVYEKIPSTLIVDSAVSSLFKDKKVDVVIVGADRINSKGDTANKIGTYQIAIAAKYHKIPFLVAASYSAIDLNDSEMKIEERSPKEILYQGEKRVVTENINVWNPAFDITPNELITAIITGKIK